VAVLRVGISSDELRRFAMNTTTMKREARKRADRVRSQGAHVGGALKDRAVVAGGTVRATAEDLGRRAAERTREPRRAVGYWIAGEKPRKRRAGRVLLAGAAGAAAAYFLDPSSGRRRRRAVGDWVSARFRRASSVDDEWAQAREITVPGMSAPTA
jgi:hypothetical protein